LIEQTNALGGIFYEAQDAIDPPGDIDFYSFPVSAGQWSLIEVVGNEINDPDAIDSVVTVFNADGSVQLARSNDDTPRTGLDSELYYRAVMDGSLCVQVEDISTASGASPRGGPTFIYAFRSLPLDSDLYDGFNIDSEENDTIGTAQSGLSYFVNTQSQFFTGVAGEINIPADRDVYVLETPSSALRANIFFTPSGPSGYGSSVSLGKVEIIGSDGSTVISRLDYANGAAGLRFPVNQNDSYFLVVDTPPGSLGTNPFYFLKYQTQDAQNPQESNDTENDSVTGSETAQALPEFDGRISHFIGGNLSGSADIDWWSFHASAGDTVSVACASRRNGTGVIDMAISLYEDPSATPLQSETESEIEDLIWADTSSASQPLVPITSTGTHYLNVSATSFSEEIVDRHYQCGIHVLVGS
jgi:hypothetical protein